MRKSHGRDVMVGSLFAQMLMARSSAASYETTMDGSARIVVIFR